MIQEGFRAKLQVIGDQEGTIFWTHGQNIYSILYTVYRLYSPEVESRRI